jgi:hypothetical protein
MAENRQSAYRTLNFAEIVHGLNAQATVPIAQFNFHNVQLPMMLLQSTYEYHSNLLQPLSVVRTFQFAYRSWKAEKSVEKSLMTNSARFIASHMD